MPFDLVAVPAALVPEGQDVLTGDLQVLAGTRIARITGLTSGVLGNMPNSTLFGNLFTEDAPGRPFKLDRFIGSGLAITNHLTNGPFPELVSESAQAFPTSSTTMVVALPRPVLRDRYIVATQHNGSNTVTTPAGWTLLSHVALADSDYNIYQFIVDQPFLDANQLTVTFTASVAGASLAKVWLVRHAHTSLNAEVVTASNTSTGGTTVDVGTLTPTWGLASNLWLVFLGLEADDTTPPHVTAFPSGFSSTGELQNASATASLDGAIAWGSQPGRLTSLDASAWTHAASRSVGFTIAIPPRVTAAISATGGGSAGWDDVLAIDSNSGANNPVVAVGQFMQFGAVGPTTNNPQIRSGDATFRIRGGGNTFVFADGVGGIAALASTGASSLCLVQAQGSGSVVALDGETLQLLTQSTVRLACNSSGVFSSPSDFTLEASGNMHLHPTGDLHLGHTGMTAFAHVEADGDIEITAGSDVTISADIAQVTALTAVQLFAPTVRFTGGFAEFTEQAASIPSMSAGQGLFWVRSDTPNVPMFTDDANVDHVLQYRGEGQLADGDKGDITVSGNFLTWAIDNDVVTYAKMQNVSATNRFIGRITAGAGDPEELTGTQATSLLDIFTTTLKGLVPGSGGGTTNFLRADGSWAAPPSGAPTSGNAITATGTQVDLTGSTSTINITPTSGALGVVNIASLLCGGTVTFQSVSEASIDGFTAKTDGFFFFLHVRDETTSDFITLLENVGATTTSIRTPNIRDWRLTKNESVMMYYSNSRWRTLASRDKLYITNQDIVTWAAQQNDFVRSGRCIELIRVTLTGNQTLTGVVPDGVTPNQEVLVIHNTDTTDTLTLLNESASSSASNRFALPGGVNFEIPPRGSVMLRYDADNNRWKVVGSCSQVVDSHVVVNTLNFNKLQQLSGHRLLGNATEATGDVQSLDQPSIARIINTGNGTGAHTICWLDEDFNKGVLNVSTNVGAGSHIGVFNGVTGWNGDWFATGIGGTGTVISQSSNAIGHNGVIICSTGATSGNGIVLYHARDNVTGGNGEQNFDADDFESFDIYVMLTSVTSVRLSCGIGSDCSVANLGSDSIFFDLNAPTDTTWHAITRAASTSTDTDTGVTAVANQWIKLSAYRNSSNNIEFYVNNLFEASHSTNVTTANVLAGLRLITNQAVLKTMHVDRVRVFLDDQAMIG